MWGERGSENLTQWFTTFTTPVLQSVSIAWILILGNSKHLLKSICPSGRKLLCTVPAHWHQFSQPASVQTGVKQVLFKSRFVLQWPRGSAGVTTLSVNRPQADPLVLGSSSQQSLSGVLVVREGHTLHHVSVVLKHRQRPQLLPSEHPHPVIPARRRQQLTVLPDAQLGDAGVDQRHTVLELQNHKEGEDFSKHSQVTSTHLDVHYKHLNTRRSVQRPRMQSSKFFVGTVKRNLKPNKPFFMQMGEGGTKIIRQTN